MIVLRLRLRGCTQIAASSAASPACGTGRVSTAALTCPTATPPETEPTPTARNNASVDTATMPVRDLRVMLAAA
jgi:hypothetical protein